MGLCADTLPAPGSGVSEAVQTPRLIWALHVWAKQAGNQMAVLPRESPCGAVRTTALESTVKSTEPAKIGPQATGGSRRCAHSRVTLLTSQACSRLPLGPVHPTSAVSRGQMLQFLVCVCVCCGGGLTREELVPCDMSPQAPLFSWSLGCQWSSPPSSTTLSRSPSLSWHFHLSRQLVVEVAQVLVPLAGEHASHQSFQRLRQL